ncbi:MAG: hypothetical protein ACRDA8_07675 [Shewanella sp.]
MWWRWLWIVVAYWLLSAHFLRYDQIYWVAVFALAPLAGLIKPQMSIRLLQLTLVISTVAVWGVSAVEMVQMRLAHDAPWQRLAAIMGTVMLFTLAAAWCGNGLLRKSSGNQAQS